MEIVLRLGDIESNAEGAVLCTDAEWDGRKGDEMHDEETDDDDTDDDDDDTDDDEVSIGRSR